MAECTHIALAQIGNINPCNTTAIWGKTQRPQSYPFDCKGSSCNDFTEGSFPYKCFCTYYIWMHRPASQIILRYSRPLWGDKRQVGNKPNDILQIVGKHSGQKHQNTFMSCFQGFCSARLSKRKSCFEENLMMQTTQCPTGDGQWIGSIHTHFSQ